VLLTACAGGADDAATPATVTPETSSTDVTRTVPSGGSTTSDVPAALQLTAPLVGGGEIELGALAGRPVLLWFWAPW
jgi:hypothetical protein